MSWLTLLIHEELPLTYQGCFGAHQSPGSPENKPLGVHLEAEREGGGLWEIASSSPGAITCMGVIRRTGVHPSMSKPHFSNHGAGTSQGTLPRPQACPDSPLPRVPRKVTAPLCAAKQPMAPEPGPSHRGDVFHELAPTWVTCIWPHSCELGVQLALICGELYKKPRHLHRRLEHLLQ